jgi:acetyl esterase/lipase
MADPAPSDRVRIEEGVVFGRGGGRDLHCDVFHPPQPGDARSAILLLHGGAWMQGDRSQLRGYGVLLGRLGYVCVASEYRLSGEAKWPAQIHDVKAALRWLRAQSPKLGIHPERIAVSGNSAGGHLALMAAGTQNQPEFEGEGGNMEVGTECAAAIAFYPPTWLGSSTGSVDNETMRRAALFAADASADVVRNASPLTHARAPYPPTLLIHGSADALVPQAASFKMHEALAAAGVPVELHVFSGAPHGFDAGRAYGRTCAQLMALFLERHGLPPALPTLTPIRVG